MVLEISVCICGIGIVSFYEIWNWYEIIGVLEDDIV